MIATTERKHYETVAKMTGLELAKIEADELHPLYAFVCEEIDARNASNGKRHALDRFDEEDAWDRSFAEWQERDILGLSADLDERFEDHDDTFTAAAGFVDPDDIILRHACEGFSDTFVDMYEQAYA